MSLYYCVVVMVDEVVEFIEYYGEYWYGMVELLVLYEIDGIVFKVDEFVLYEEFGVISCVLCWVIVYKYLLE